MTRCRSKRVALVIVGGVVLVTAVIVGGVIYRGGLDAEHARVLRGQAVAENRWEGQSANSLRLIIRSTVQSLDEPIAQAQATYDSTARRASEEIREALKNAIEAAGNAPRNTLAKVDVLTDVKDLSVATENATKLIATHKEELVNAKKSADDQAAAFDAAEAKKKADAAAAAKKSTPRAPSPGDPTTPIPPSEVGTDATRTCLGGGTGYAAAIACINALDFGVTVAVEWSSLAGGGGQTIFNPSAKTANITLADGRGAYFGSDAMSTSIVMHEAGHASSARCEAVADDPVFDQPISPQFQSDHSPNNKQERYATAFAIAHGAPDHAAAGEWAYGITSTPEEIATALRC